jgi:hypothetical protein
MEASDLQHTPFRILTFRDGQRVIAEDVETEVAAWTRFTSAIDLCKTRDDGHVHRVELHDKSGTVDKWLSAGS